MRRKNDDVVVWHFGKLIDEYRAAFFQAVNHKPVVDHFMTHINRWLKDFQRALNNGYGSVNTGTKTSRIS